VVDLMFVKGGLRLGLLRAKKTFLRGCHPPSSRLRRDKPRLSRYGMEFDPWQDGAEPHWHSSTFLLGLLLGEVFLENMS
jgi:hypothetical protein